MPHPFPVKVARSVKPVPPGCLALASSLRTPHRAVLRAPSEPPEGSQRRVGARRGRRRALTWAPGDTPELLVNLLSEL